MKKFSNNKEINNIVFNKLKLKNWKYRRGNKHFILILPNNRKISIPSTPSDVRAIKNFTKDLKKAENQENYYV